MINLHERMLPTSAGVEPTTSWSPVGRSDILFGRRCGVSLILCCLVVYSTTWFVLCLALCHFVFVLFSPFSIAITLLEEERASLGAFRMFVRIALVLFYLFPLPLGVRDGLQFVIVALLLPFF